MTRAVGCFAGWRKSSRSAVEGNCVEAGSAPGFVGVRDSKDRQAAVLVFSRSRWAEFVATLREES
ncbi:DUF397 domain-containing protein [Saccharopolyspora rosea]|uniref:DUF397 domain-containing protein n=1 Tax=Saccharopolyspora rosea TaxID=524884 RepID=A0ABW3FQG7_9PSEU|nr:DUF397 domain-containing protein [Saccharopolyspora rosea]